MGHRLRSFDTWWYFYCRSHGKRCTHGATPVISSLNLLLKTKTKKRYDSIMYFPSFFFFATILFENSSFPLFNFLDLDLVYVG